MTEEELFRAGFNHGYILAYHGSSEIRKEFIPVVKGISTYAEGFGKGVELGQEQRRDIDKGKDNDLSL